MRFHLIVAVLLAAWNPLFAEDQAPFDGWVMPGATSKHQVVSPVIVTLASGSKQTITHGSGHYEIREPFHEVVLFYARKSGLEPGDWGSLSLEFPGHGSYLPAHYSRPDDLRRKPSVTLLHSIREEVATAQLLVTDHPTQGFLSIAISRGRSDELTVIQLIKHSSDRIDPETVQVKRPNREKDAETSEGSSRPTK